MALGCSYRSRDAREGITRGVAVASKTHDHAGDGTTAATVLAQSIVREGMKSVAAGMNPMDLKRGIDLAVSRIVEDLKSRSNDVGRLCGGFTVGEFVLAESSPDRPCLLD